MTDVRVGEVVILTHLGNRTFGVVTSIELDGVGVMLPSGATITTRESNLQAPPAELRDALNAAVARALSRRGIR